MNDTPAGRRVDPETLAAYIDGRLPPADRASVEAILAADPDAYELLVRTMAATDQLPEYPERPATGPDTPPLPVVAAPPPRSRSWRAGPAVTAALAAAAALALVVQLSPEWWRRLWSPGVEPAFASLVEAVGEERYFDARLTGGFKYGPLRDATRGAASTSSQNLQLVAAAGVLQAAAASDPTPTTLHAWGVAQMLLGDPQGAIAVLEPLAGSTRAAAIRSDLAAAYITAAQSGPSPHLWPRALEQAQASCDVAVNAGPACFNRALALEHLGLLPEAIAAWQGYVAGETEAEWKRLAQARLDSLAAPSGDLRGSLDELTAPNHDDATRLAGLRSLLGGLASSRTSTQLSCALRLQDFYYAGAMSPLGAQAAECRRGLGASIDELTAFVRMHEAVAQFYGGRMAEGEALATSTLALARTPFMSGRLLYALAAFRFAAADYQAAQSLLQRCLDAADARDLHTIAGAHQMSAEVLRAVGQFDEAWTAYLKVVPLFDRLPLLRRHAFLTSLGRAAIAQDLPRVATAAFRAAETNAIGQQWVAPRFEARMNGAHAQLVAGDLPAATATLATARAMVDRLDPAIAERAAIELAMIDAELLAERGDPHAVSRIDTSLRQFAERGLRLRVGVLHALAARVAFRQGRGDEARRHVELGVAAVEAESASLASDASRRAHLDKVWQLYRLGALLDVLDGRAAPALERLERGKRLLLDHADAVTLRPAVGDAYLVFARLDGRLYRWDVLDSGVSVREIDLSLEELEASLSEFRAVVAGNSHAPLDRVFTGLGARLLSDVEALPERVRRIVVVADGLLAGTPFAALSLPGCRCPLVVRYATTQSSSIAAYQRSVASPRLALETVSFFADATGPERFRPLPYARAEVTQSASWYERPAIFTGAAVTRAEVVEALRHSRLVHFAGHALGDAATPALSGLLMSDAANPWLSARDFPPSQAQLVILAACDTSYASRASGPGGPALATLLMERGAKGVIGTVAPVRDRDAAEFFVELHRALSEGLEPTQALRQTQIAIRQAHPTNWSWSAMTLYGS